MLGWSSTTRLRKDLGLLGERRPPWPAREDLLGVGTSFQVLDFSSLNLGASFFILAQAVLILVAADLHGQEPALGPGRSGPASVGRARGRAA